MTMICLFLWILDPYDDAKFSLFESLLQVAIQLLSLLFIYCSQYFIFILLQLYFLISSKLFFKSDVLVNSFDIAAVILLNFIIGYQIRYHFDFPKGYHYYVRWNLYNINIIFSIAISTVTILFVCVRILNSKILFNHTIKRTKN